MKIFISSDHAGFELKNKLVEYLSKKSVEVVDKGPASFDPNDDYPNLIALVASEVSKDTTARGVVIGLSGQGEAMAANRFKNVRAGVFYGGSDEIIKLLCEHNNCNVLSLGAKFVPFEDAVKAVELWMETPFSNESRHERRVAELDNLSNSS